MSNEQFKFNFKFKLHKSYIPIGLEDNDNERLAVVYGVNIEDVIAEVNADIVSNTREANILLKHYPDAVKILAGKRIAFLGDSISSDRRSFCNIIRKAIGEDKAVFYDDSISAYKLNDIITNHVPRLQDFHAEIAHIMIGSNDAKRTTDGKNYQLTLPEEFRRELQYLLPTLRAQGMKLIISTIPPFDEKKVRDTYYGVNVTYTAEDICTYNKVIREEAERANCILNDMEPIYAEYTTTEFTWDDGLHLNLLGQRLMADAVLGKMLGG